MNIEETFPERFWINLARRADRRGEMEWMLERTGITAERFPAVDARFVKKVPSVSTPADQSSVISEDDREQEAAGGEDGWGEAATFDGSGRMNSAVHPAVRPAARLVRGYESAGRYALALTKRLALRKARQRGASAVLLMEDDCVLHPNLRALLEGIELPDDWGILYLGCAHYREAEPVGPGLVRLKKSAVVDNHAVAVRAPYFNRVIRALDAHGKAVPDHPRASDRYLAALADEIPSYACFPNLAWQATEESDLMGIKYSSYRVGGTQKHKGAVVDRIWERMYGGGRPLRGPGNTKLGLLFLTRGEVNLPEVWREFIAGAPERVRIFSHPKDPDAVVDGFLERTVIDELHETQWGSISLVRATLALLRAALADESLTHFVLLSESCAPVKPLPEILRELDWNPKSRFKVKTLEEAGPLQRSRAAALPQVPAECWRFQSQWWLMDRIAAMWVARADYTEIFARMGIPDEAYFATVLSLTGYPVDDRITNQAVTWVHWEKDAGHPTAHPIIPPQRLEEILDSGAWFARKFPPGSDIGDYGLHRALWKEEVGKP